MSLTVYGEGRLVADAELVDVKGDAKVLRFRIGTNRWNGEADFFRCSAFIPAGKDDEYYEKVTSRVAAMKKGRLVWLADATIEISSWETEGGEKRSAPEIRLRSPYSVRFDFKAVYGETAVDSSNDDDDVPF